MQSDWASLGRMRRDLLLGRRCCCGIFATVLVGIPVLFNLFEYPPDDSERS